MESTSWRPARPYLLSVCPGVPVTARVEPIAGRPNTLVHGDMGLLVRVSHLESVAEQRALLVIPYDARRLGDVENGPVRVYRYDATHEELIPVWESGIKPAFRFVWAVIRRSGTYVPVSLRTEAVSARAPLAHAPAS